MNPVWFVYILIPIYSKLPKLAKFDGDNLAFSGDIHTGLEPGVDATNETGNYVV
jgi:hypothetical protein